MPYRPNLYRCNFRSKRVAPTLIREITRRVNQKGIFQACYTAGVVIPKPVGTARYHHRNLNPKKLVAIQFTSLGKNQVSLQFLYREHNQHFSDYEPDDASYESSRSNEYTRP